MVNSTATGYRQLREVPLRTIEGTLIELVHESTGARHLHLATDDDNNGFTVAFNTLPPDSTGVAHILEHSVLDGSERYPVKTFFSMVSRSVATFMNATTGADRTFYWFTSRNPKDFQNLLDVYLDAVFFPLLAEETLLQEGRRLEFEKPDDPGSPLRFKGVVFNEMKSGSTSAGAAIGEALRRLYAGTAYEHNSGGDPRVIPDLTYDGLRAFHRRHYHPSNAVFFTYGAQALEPLLERIEERALRRFDRGERVHTPLITRRGESFKQDVRFAIGPNEDPARKGQALLAWVTVDTADAGLALSMRVLAEYLLQGDAAPLRRALLESGLGSALADGSGLSESAREASFAAGLKDIDPEQADAVGELVLGCLREQAKGVDRALMDTVLEQLELRYRERSNTPISFALRTVVRVLNPLVRDADPVPALELDEHFERLRKGVSGGVFEHLIEEQLLENPHRTLITARADPGLAREREAEESERLRTIESTLDEAARAALVEQARRLKERQDAEKDLTCLPGLELGDLQIEVADASPRRQALGAAIVELYGQPTASVSYVQVNASAAGLPSELVERIGLLQAVLPRLGAGRFDPTQMAVRIARSTGGLSVAVNTAVPVAGGIVATVALGSHALSRKQAELVGILSDLMTLPKLEPARLREVARETFARMQTGLSFQTLSLAPLLAASPISDASAFLERSVGVTSFERLKALAAADASAFDEEAEVLGRLWRRLFSPERIQVVATAPDDALGELAGELAEVIAGLTGGTGNGSAPPARPPRHGGVARTLPMLVSTNAKVFPGPGYGHPDAPALAVLARLLQSRILHPEIREKGGAYGSRALADLDHETFELISYSDPNVARTHEVWRSLLGRLDGTSADDVRSAIIATSKELNPLLSPDMRGPAAWRNRALGRSTELRSQFRDAVLSVTLDHLRRVAETYLVEERASVATIGNADAIADANDRLQLFETVEPLI